MFNAALPEKDPTMDAEQLVKVIKKRDANELAPFLTGGFDLDAPLPLKNESTPYELAVTHGALDIAVALIKAGVTLRPKDLNLVWITQSQDEEVVRLFIDRGADVNAGSYMGTPLEVAAKLGLSSIARTLIEAGADPNAGSTTSCPLKEGVAKNHLKIVETLLQAGAAIRADDNLVLQAVEQRNPQMIRILAAAGAHVDQRGDVYEWDGAVEEQVQVHSYATPLIVASARGQRAEVEALLKADADPHLGDADGATALDWAGRRSHLQIATLLEAAMAERPRSVSPETDLLLACQQGALDSVKELLAGGADVDARDVRPKFRGHTPLMIAAASGHVEVVITLLQGGAGIHLRDDTDPGNDGGFSLVYNEGGAEMAAEAGFQMLRTPLHWAAEGGHGEVVRLLLERGLDCDDVDRAKCTPLLLAAEAGSAEAVQALLEAGAAVNQRNRGREAAVHLAARNGHAQVVRMLCEAGAKPDLKDRDGHTALMRASSRAWPDAVAALVEAGADVHVTEKICGWTPLHQPLGTSHLLKDVEGKEFVIRYTIPPERILETVRVLVEAGADPHASDQFDETPLTRAKQMVDMTGALQEVVDLLEHAAGSSPSPARQPMDKKVALEKPAPPPRPPKRKSPKLKPPTFIRSSKSKAYAAAVDEMERLCGTRRQPLGDIPGAFAFHVHSRMPFDLKRTHREFLEKGAYVFSTNPLKEDQVAMLPTTRWVDVVATMKTNGANYELMPEDIVAWLRELEQEQPFTLTGIGHDFLSGAFTRRVVKPRALAERMYAFCPDIVDQGCGDVQTLGAELRKSRRLFLWWD